ncbi:hypothetical protein BSKO_14072 [Bryopsis sp. KO-2023]|nr:hypothetical protein BSKO_14072 [Bryopsis sp. KO-2023]
MADWVLGSVVGERKGGKAGDVYRRRSEGLVKSARRRASSMEAENMNNMLSPADKFFQIEQQLLREGVGTIDEGTPVRNSGLGSEILPSSVPPEHLLHSWPLLKKRRAILSGIATTGAFLLKVLVAVAGAWYLFGLAGLLFVFLALEAGFFVFSQWRAVLFNRQPERIEPPGHDAWGCFKKFIESAQLKDEKENLLMDIRDYTTVWFRGAKFEDVKRENMMDLLAYGFWYKSREQMKEEGLGSVPEKMLSMLEAAAQVKFAEGRTENLKFMSHLWDPVHSFYRPMCFYLLMEFLGILAHSIMNATGFVQHQHAGYTYFTFAGDPDTARLTRHSRRHSVHSNPMRRLSVMGNPLPEPKPIVFLHGVGVGILPYLDFIQALVCTGHPVIVVEYRHVAMRLCIKIPTCDEVAAGVASILDQVDVQDACFVSHSYGTFVLARILKARPERVHSTCFIDPVCMGMFFPRLLSTFVYSPARTDTWEHVVKDVGRMLVCKEVGIASTMCRGFAWSDLNVWPDNLPENKSLVVFSGQDILVPGAELKRILEVSGTKTNIMWHDDLSHGEFLMHPSWKMKILDEIVTLALGDVVQSKAEAEAERAVRKASLIVSMNAMDDLHLPIMKSFEKRISKQVQRTLSMPWQP